MPDKEFTVIEVQPRKSWKSSYGAEFQDYAVRLHENDVNLDIDGYIQLTQKPETPEPVVGQILFGHTIAETRGANTYLKFKKVNPNWDNSSQTAPKTVGGLLPEKTLEYAVQMLEELTGRRTKPNDIDKDIDEGEEFSLDEIPF